MHSLSLFYDMPSKTSTLAHSKHLQFSKTETRRNMRENQKRKGKNIRPDFKDPIYLHKSRNEPQVADPVAPGDTHAHAHAHDDNRLLKKLLPQGQEHRGCKSRDVDLRTKRDNKSIPSGVCQHIEGEGASYDKLEDFE